MPAEITRVGILDMQVCVPEDWTDEQVTDFANNKNSCGTSHGWGIRKEGSMLLAGSSERAMCAQKDRYVHIMLDA